MSSRNIKGVVNDIFNDIYVYIYKYLTDISIGILTVTKLYIQGILNANTW